MPRLDRQTAARIVDALAVALDGRPASAKTFSDAPFIDDPDRSWWAGEQIPKDTPRTAALVLAYLLLSGGTVPRSGIELDDGWFRPDSWVVGALAKSGRVEIGDDAIVLTQSGWQWIAQILEKLPEAVKTP